MSEPALRRGAHEPSHYQRVKLFVAAPRSLIDARATCITRSASTSCAPGNRSSATR